MGKWLAFVAVILLATAAFAADPPDAPSAVRAAALHGPATLDMFPLAHFDVSEWTAMVAVSRPEQKKVADKKFFLLTGVATGLTVADFEMTQSCMARHVCVESDPLMPTSHAAMYASSVPVNAALYYWSYRLKAKGSRFWWVPTVAVIASHAIGVGTNLRFLH